MPTNPDAKSPPQTARGPAPGLTGPCGGTADEINTSSERARRGLDRAPRVKPALRAGDGRGSGGVEGAREGPQEGRRGTIGAAAGSGVGARSLGVMAGCAVQGHRGVAARGHAFRCREDHPPHGACVLCPLRRARRVSTDGRRSRHAERARISGVTACPCSAPAAIHPGVSTPRAWLRRSGRTANPAASTAGAPRPTAARAEGTHHRAL